MHNAILVSSNNEFRQPCHFRLAQQLLRQGLAKIVQYYPLTIQFKGDKPQDEAAVTGYDGNKPPRMDVYKNILMSEYSA